MSAEIKTNLTDGKHVGAVLRGLQERADLLERVGFRCGDGARVDAEGAEEAARVGAGEVEVGACRGDGGGEEVHLRDADGERLADDLGVVLVEEGVGEVEAAVDELGDAGEGVVHGGGAVGGPRGDEGEDVLVLQRGAGVDDGEAEQVLGEHGGADGALDELQLDEGAAEGELLGAGDGGGVVVDGLGDLGAADEGARAEGVLQADLGGAVGERDDPADLDDLGLDDLEVLGVEELEVEQPVDLVGDRLLIGGFPLQMADVFRLLRDRVAKHF